MNIGKNIKKYRNISGLTQIQLAKKIEKSESTIQKYESNAVTPDFSTLADISNVLEVDINELLEIDSNIDKNNSYNMKKSIRKNIDGIKFGNMIIQNSLLYNLILSILMAKNNSSDLIDNLNLDSIEQVAAQILYDTKDYIFPIINTTINKLNELPRDVSFGKEARNLEIQNYQDNLPRLTTNDIKSIIHVENDDNS